MNLLSALFPCLPVTKSPCSRQSSVNQTTKTSSVYNEKQSVLSKESKLTEEEAAKNILNILFTADKPADIRRQLHDHVQAYGWTDALARRILDGLVNAVHAGAAMGGAMKEAFDRASFEAEKFVNEHPVLTAVIVTVVAIGILEILMPWAIAALGFGELGPIEGSFAAWWQSTYPNVPYGSLFSYLQRLGMTLGK